MAIAEIRLKRTEQDIETLRSTQSALMDRIGSFSETLEEARDIAADNQARLQRVEDRLDKVEDRLKLVEEVVLENRAIILDNRTILLNIADHLDLTLEKPNGDSQLD